MTSFLLLSIHFDEDSVRFITLNPKIALYISDSSPPLLNLLELGDIEKKAILDIPDKISKAPLDFSGYRLFWVTILGFV